MIQFTCQLCGTIIKTTDESAGKTGKCRCGEVVRIPTPAFPAAESGDVVLTDLPNPADDTNSYLLRPFTAARAADDTGSRSRCARWLLSSVMLFLVGAAWLVIAYLLYPRIPVTVQLEPGHTRTFSPGLGPFIPPWVALGVLSILMTVFCFRWTRIQANTVSGYRIVLRRLAWWGALVAVAVPAAILPMSVARLTATRVRAIWYLREVSLAHEQAGHARHSAGHGRAGYRQMKKEEILPYIDGREFHKDPVTGGSLVYFDDIPDRDNKEPLNNIIIAAFPKGPDDIRAILTADGDMRFVPSEQVDESRGILKPALTK